MPDLEPVVPNSPPPELPPPELVFGLPPAFPGGSTWHGGMTAPDWFDQSPGFPYDLSLEMP